VDRVAFRPDGHRASADLNPDIHQFRTRRESQHCFLLGLDPRNIPTAQGFFGTGLGGIQPPAWRDGFIAVLCLSIIRLSYRGWQRQGTRRYGYSSAVASSILASFHLYDYDLILLLLVFLLMAGQIRHRITKAAAADPYLPAYRLPCSWPASTGLSGQSLSLRLRCLDCAKLKRLNPFGRFGVDNGNPSFGGHSGLQ